ncbi:MAG TPA: GGDEF domain-containing protein [Bryobacteraceae bacterium]|nr:GGDEF domain-containing protein [Bryobacteraceae bacterium]
MGAPSIQFADPTAFLIQEIGALLFCMVFLFLWRQSRVVYFGLWAGAWVIRILAAIFGFELLRTYNSDWLAPYATFEFAFAIVLISAARAGFASDMKDWRTSLRLIAILPIFVAIVWALGQKAGLEAYHITHALVLGFVYLYNFLLLRRHRGIGSRIFRFSLMVLAIVFFEHAAMLFYIYHHGTAPQWAQYMHNETYYDFELHCMLAFAAMAMWSETQIDRIRDLSNEVDHLRRENTHRFDLDHLTGLLNQAALARRVEAPEGFEGAVAVCDMDNFKEINDRYGHLVGDEILRNVGHLLANSIRHQDEAYRWGGDEFVILFQDQQPEVARKRMGEIEARLREFRVRGFGVLPIGFSWGTTDARGRPLRDALDEADRDMYALKRSRGSERQPKAV